METYRVYVEPCYIGFAGTFTDCEHCRYRREAGDLPALRLLFSRIIGCKPADIRFVMV